MRIVNKQQFRELPNGTVYCLYYPDEIDQELIVKTNVYEYNGEKQLNGVTHVCPYFYEERFNKIPSTAKTYDTESFNVDTSLCDYDDDQLFAIFSKSEIRMMISILTYALSDCNGDAEYDDLIIQ